jgi:hypothetical protein
MSFASKYKLIPIHWNHFNEYRTLFKCMYTQKQRLYNQEHIFTHNSPASVSFVVTSYVCYAIRDSRAIRRSKLQLENYSRLWYNFVQPGSFSPSFLWSGLNNLPDFMAQCPQNRIFVKVNSMTNSNLVQHIFKFRGSHWQLSRLFSSWKPSAPWLHYRSAYWNLKVYDDDAWHSKSLGLGIIS